MSATSSRSVNGKPDRGSEGGTAWARRRLRKACVSLGAAVIAGLAVAGLVSGTAPASAATSATATSRNWIGVGWNIHLSDQADPATTSHFFNKSGSFGTGPNPAADPVQDNYSSNAALVYQSYAQFASDIASKAITYPYRWVMYDPEEWQNTPLDEQQDPVKYLGLFGQLAHARGYRVIETPARDLGNVAGSVIPRQPREALNQWYLRAGLARAAAAASDVYVVQDQVNTTSLADYTALFNGARHQALAAKPGATVDAEVSTNYGTASDMVAAARSVRANGYYVSTTSAGVGQATQFLRQMRSAGY